MRHIKLFTLLTILGAIALVSHGCATVSSECADNHRPVAVIGVR